MQKLVLGVEYDGASYCGWQKQKNLPSIQACIEDALKKIISTKVTIYCAGRTDAGVHALGQVVHFETDVQYPQSAWVFGVNRYLPSSICVRWASLVDEKFHARFSAISRRYCYVIYNSCIRSAILSSKSWHYRKFLDVYKMSIAGKYLLGEKDFSAFRSIGCQSSSAWRKIYHLYVMKKGPCIIIDITANSFIYHMVRNIVGSLVEIGCGKQSTEWILELLKNNHNRSLAGVTAPANGLYLVEVKYPSYFLVPSVFSKNFWD